jgi:hypothetical protein
MKLIKQLTLAIVLMAAGATNVQAQYVKVPHAYMFGFVASFNDSTVYFTNIQKVDSVWVTNKKSMLAGRNQYSYQLRDYFAQQRNMPNRTCVVVANTDLKKLEKKYIKMKNKYLVKSKKPYDVRSLNETDFKFLPVDMNYE